MGEKIVNVPNALSFYRILVFPYIFYLLLSGNEKMFAIFLCINLLTDFLDGFIARTFNQITLLGARLDSLADYGTYFLAFYGVIVFKRNDLDGNGWIFYIFIAMMVLTQVIHYYRFGTFSSYHLYSFKTTGYFHALLFILWFFVGFYPAYYYFAIGFGILAETESIVLTLMLSDTRSNARGLFWIIKEKSLKLE
jgi:cardiolipin synthase (CMP-forming)